MALINYLAEVWGISMAIIGLALLVKERHLKSLFAKIETEESLFIWGIISLVMGIAMILSYNVWMAGWQVLITIFGWVALLKGICLLFVPEMTKKWAKKMENSPMLPIGLLIMVFVGLALVYLGFVS